MRKNVVLSGIVSLIFLLSPLTFILGVFDAPTLVYPKASNSPVWKGRIEFSWNATGAPFYQYHINLPNGESLEETATSLKKTTTGLPIGNYSWAVRSCDTSPGTDINCGGWSTTEVFEIILAPAEFSGGFIPCGREIDDASTPGYDESDPCGVSHIFLLLKNLLDFVLWKLSLFIILGMAVFTGAISYFSFGRGKILVSIKSLWKSVFIGYLIALFAWFGVNLVLNLLGFQTKIFGQWWQLPF